MFDILEVFPCLFSNHNIIEYQVCQDDKSGPDSPKCHHKIDVYGFRNFYFLVSDDNWDTICDVLENSLTEEPKFDSTKEQLNWFYSACN